MLAGQNRWVFAHLAVAGHAAAALEAVLLVNALVPVSEVGKRECARICWITRTLVDSLFVSLSLPNWSLMFIVLY